MRVSVEAADLLPAVRLAKKVIGRGEKTEFGTLKLATSACALGDCLSVLALGEWGNVRVESIIPVQMLGIIPVPVLSSDSGDGTFVRLSVLESVLAAIPRGPIFLDAPDGGWVRIAAQGTHLLLDPCIPSSLEAWEMHTPAEDAWGGMVEAEDLLALLTATDRTRMREKNFPRPVLNGVKLEWTTDCMVRAVSTDGRRLTLAMRLGKGVTAAQSFVLKSETVAFLLSALRGRGGKGIQSPPVGFSLNANPADPAGDRLQIAGDGFRLQTTTLEGNFVNYASVLPAPKSITCTVIVDKTKLAQAVKVAGQFFKTTYFSNAPILHTHRDCLTVHGGSADLGKTYSAIPAEVTGNEALEIGLNPRYLLDGLKGIRGPRVRLQFQDASRTVLMTPADEDPTDSSTFRYLLMPIRLRGWGTDEDADVQRTRPDLMRAQVDELTPVMTALEVAR